MDQIKCIITDIDGTFVHDDGLVTKECAVAFRSAKESGIYIFPATGRCQGGIKQIFNDETREITDYKGYPGIFHNGGLIIGPDGYNDVVSEYTIDKDSVLKIIEYLKSLRIVKYNQDETHLSNQDFYDDENSQTYQEEFRHLVFGLYSHDNGYVEKKCFSVLGARIHKVAGVNTKYVDDLSEFVENTGILPNKITIIENSKTILKLAQELDYLSKELNIKVVLSHCECIDILPNGVSKGNAAKALLDKLNINMENVMAIGDAENDLEILNLVGYPVAMGNAMARVKEVTKFHVRNNTEDGFIDAIYHIAGVTKVTNY